MPSSHALSDPHGTVQRAIAGDAAAVRALVLALAPEVRVAVARVLHRYRGRGRGRPIEQEVEDLAQDVFAALFEDGARVLRSWDPQRGAALPTFVRLVAERTAYSVLRNGKRSPWTEEPTLSDDLDRPDSARRWPEARVATREQAERLYARLREELTPRGFQLFLRLIVEEANVADVCAELGMQADAIYAWRSRFGKLVRRLSSEGSLGSDTRGAAAAPHVTGGEP